MEKLCRNSCHASWNDQARHKKGGHLREMCIKVKVRDECGDYTREAWADVRWGHWVETNEKNKSLAASR